MVHDAHAHVHVFGRDFSLRLAEYYLGLYGSAKSWMTGRPWTAEDWCVPSEKLLEHMDAAGVDRLTIMAFASVPLESYDPTMGDYIAELCRQHPGRFVGMYSADPLGGETEAERLRRAVVELGLTGLKLLPTYSGAAINDRRIWPLYAAAAELDVAVVVHTGWSVYPGGRTLAHDHPLQLEDVLADFPSLRAVVAHCGFAWSEHVLMLLAAHPSLGADFAWWGASQPPWRAAQTLSMAKYLDVAERLVWGTDYPFTSLEDDLAYWRQVPAVAERMGLEPTVTDKDVESFLGLNVTNFLGLGDLVGSSVPATR